MGLKPANLAHQGIIGSRDDPVVTCMIRKLLHGDRPHRGVRETIAPPGFFACRVIGARHPDNAGKHAIGGLDHQAVEQLVPGVLRLVRQDIEHCVHQVPVTERRAIAVTWPYLFPGVWQRRLRGMDRSLVEFRDVGQHRSPTRLSERRH